MVSYLQNTFVEVPMPVIADPGDRVTVTAVETISAEGKTIPSFLILPGVNIPESWVLNASKGGTTVTTSPRGYITDIHAIEWLEHFEIHTRPADPIEKRVLIMDNQESHHTAEWSFNRSASSITSRSSRCPSISHIYFNLVMLAYLALKSTGIVTC